MPQLVEAVLSHRAAGVPLFSLLSLVSDHDHDDALLRFLLGEDDDRAGDFDELFSLQAVFSLKPTMAGKSTPAGLQAATRDYAEECLRFLCLGFLLDWCSAGCWQ